MKWCTEIAVAYIKKTLIFWDLLYVNNIYIWSFFILFLGANAYIKNNENKMPYNLAKDPQSAAFLQQAVRPIQQYSEDYGDEEDSD